MSTAKKKALPKQQKAAQKRHRMYSGDDVQNAMEDVKT